MGRPARSLPAIKPIPLSNTSTGNLERLGTFVDASYLKDQRHKESIKRLVTTNKNVNEQFWSHVKRLAGLLSKGMLTADKYQQHRDEKVEGFLQNGEPQSEAPGEDAEGGGSQMDQKTRPAKKTDARRGSAEVRVAANTQHGNIINCRAGATQQHVSVFVACWRNTCKLQVLAM